ncbi:hypothetical protein LTR47_005884 [Exophiala xenobiotica]|nr:hypothetical protein LTR47_005884 [Exophiala xenobiotica]KAK5243256.1 hypothetical protein LTS06_010936 [Exophiala xenobiotica]KAK5350939.1 hypothetical protein LTR61_005292 [Exophiala xenobiotica]KAK5373919.1 hypothetical protein LTS03_006074 [Exophiala xenobiotica]KAK5374473.1 hypothetical protein LTR11_005680 [Exophiala xenobiotica]
MSVLPSTTYQSPPRLARGRQLNTIIEEKEDGSQAVKSDSEGDGSDSTVIGRPAAWNSQLFTAAARKTSLATTTYASSPISSCEPSPASSASDGFPRNSARSSYSENSENGTVFSDDCPSLASDPTTFASESSRNSYGSNRSSRNRYPALIIPRDSWGSMDGSPIKEIAYGMSPATKIRLSPTALSALSRSVPAANAPPSLGDSNSTTSESPCNPGTSAPVTPDMRQLVVTEGESWGVPPPAPGASQHLEIAFDDGHSVILSPAEAHSDHSLSNLLSPAAILSPSATAWTEMVISFPPVPGATPQDQSPLMPTIDELKTFEPVKPRSNGSDPGVRLPPDALQILQRLAGYRSVDNQSNSSGSGSSKRSGRRQEMRELGESNPISRPRSADGETPVSDYSFTQLSIPSPGGFFSSLQNGSRHTWCLSRSKGPSMPNTATAEMFYNRPWEDPNSNNVVETFLTVDDTNLTEGPPTARQATFHLESPNRQNSTSPNSEDDDLYGPGDVAKEPSGPRKGSFEYDDRYLDELKQTASRNLDLTGSWLAAQTGYLSAILDSDPNVDHNGESEVTDVTKTKTDTASRRTVMFSKDTKIDSAVVVSGSKKDRNDNEADAKEAIFLTAFQYLLSNRKRRDAFIHATSRLEAIQAFRVAMPEKHITNLLGQHVLVEHKRPRYAGPFGQNPRATGIFEPTTEQAAYKAAEREQLALGSIEPWAWQIDALRTMYGGRLLASEAACQRLKAKATVPLDDPACIGSKRIRVLDIGGTSCASWAWNAALEWPNVKIYTVITKEQSQSQRPSGKPKPEAPNNHRTVSVPHLWQLPFRSGHFDVISARSLHVLLKNNPVPGVPEIDEWDLTLRECQRVLKPGGFIDYMIMDSTIAHAGPRGDAMSVEFGFELHRRGYEREAARSWLRRLKKEGFVGVKRAWVFMPMGRKPPKEVEENAHGFIGEWKSWRQGAKPFVPAPRPISEVSTISKIVKQYMDVEAVQGPVGSTEDVADLTGLLGARMWEEWLVKVRAESGRERSRWLEGVDEVIEEGKENGSGWKVLIGWARKPKPEKGKKAERAEITVAVEDLEELSPTSEECTEMGMIPMVIQG